MNYTLAKQLKDAGFPQIRHYDIKDCEPEPLEDGSYNKNDFIAIPTLSELIEACGDRFYSVVRALPNDWRAFSDRDDANTIATADGSTPEEAVAKLWLEINKK